MKDLYIIGAGGFGREVAWLVKRINEVKATWNVVGFIDDNSSLWDIKINGYEVAGSIERLDTLPNVWVVCAIGNSRARKKAVSRLKNVCFATLIDPSVKISDHVSVGEGSIICAGSIVTVDVKIGKHTIVNLDCTIGHDVILSDFVTLYPSVNISGEVVINKLTEFGTGSQVIQGLTVAEGATIGAGSVVIRNIEDNGTYAGCPAKRIEGR